MTVSSLDRKYNNYAIFTNYNYITQTLHFKLFLTKSSVTDKNMYVITLKNTVHIKIYIRPLTPGTIQ